MTATNLAFDYQDVVEAARRLDGYAVRTPLLENALLNERVGGRVLLKPEVLQRSGSFKFRGAFNRLSQLSEDERKGGVVAWSSGNHAQGVAAAAAILGLRAAIVMPKDAPALKIANTRGYGADVVLYDRWTESREDIARGIAEERGSATVPPFDHPQIMAGQGTVGLEIVEQAQALGAVPDDVIAPCSGGGLVSGIATAVKHFFPDTRVWSAEPAGFDDVARSLAKGERVGNEGGHASICDALMSPSPGALTFPVMKDKLAGGLAVTDAEVQAAMAYAFTVLKLVVEPGGAAGLAAVLSGKLPARGRTVAVVLSGGNVDPDTFVDALKVG
ncbi:threonine ammonia-lyase [Azospirillum rugosum]|uniref:Threonine dehydratase n=1 Tax=Azospirillum rugosum TaxID=416170 RepID=A0ABS4SY61_9PROT|nr:threonine/serine dehydratase [Azospirillum rugosum]MBP2296932.1 threonine dehydratase [Azospirillum rugosum]MDQ0530691.1 threonine dehydratase [Azospirillum rugosum]